MEVDFTPEQRRLVQQAIESGRIRRPEDAALEAFSLWVERERLAALRTLSGRSFDQAQAQAQAAAARLLQRRERHPLPEGVTIRDLVHAGRD